MDGQCSTEHTPSSIGMHNFGLFPCQEHSEIIWTLLQERLGNVFFCAQNMEIDW